MKSAGATGSSDEDFRRAGKKGKVHSFVLPRAENIPMMITRDITMHIQKIYLFDIVTLLFSGKLLPHTTAVLHQAMVHAPYHFIGFLPGDICHPFGLAWIGSPTGSLQGAGLPDTIIAGIEGGCGRTLQPLAETLFCYNTERECV